MSSPKIFYENQPRFLVFVSISIAILDWNNGKLKCFLLKLSCCKDAGFWAVQFMFESKLSIANSPVSIQTLFTNKQKRKNLVKNFFTNRFLYFLSSEQKFSCTGNTPVSKKSGWLHSWKPWVAISRCFPKANFILGHPVVCNFNSGFVTKNGLESPLSILFFIVFNYLFAKLTLTNGSAAL